MKIGIDATLVREDRISGVERYVIELVNNIAKVYKTANFEIYCQKSGLKYFNNLPQNFEIKVSPFSNKVLTEQIWLPIIINKSSINLLHLTNLAPSPLIRKKSIITIHDAVPWRYVSVLSVGMKYYCKPILTFFIKQKKPYIITDSEFSKNEISSLLHIEKGKISTVYIGKNKSFRKSDNESIDKIKKKFNITSNYLIVLGTIEPRKNLDRLLLAYEKIAGKISESLVIVGRHGWQKELKISKKIRDRVILTGFVQDSDLIPLISGARAFLFPSFYEGFGLPLIEAQSCGIPCIISNKTSLPEIAGDSVSYFDPFDIDSIAESIEKTLANPDKLIELSQKGFTNALKYSWINCAKQSFLIYAKFCGV